MGKIDILVQGVRIGYEDPTLHDLSLEIEEGMFAGILGPNGCGKTTLVKCLVKNLKPWAGHISVQDKPLTQIPPLSLAQKIGVVPQSFNHNFAFTVEEIVEMGRFPHRAKKSPLSFLEKQKISQIRRDRDIVREVMVLTKIEHLALRPITNLSGGELQRVIIAQALAQEPKILILDEATAHLDINHQIEILELLTKLNKEQGLTVVSVMHDLNLASQYCNQVILVSEGHVFSVGSPKSVLTQQNIQEVYGAKVQVFLDPVTQRPFIRPSYGVTTEKRAGLRIHMIGGGGMCGTVLETLVQQGNDLSMGVINIYDGDWERALALEVKTVVEGAFLPIGKDSFEQNKTLIKEADLLVIGNIPFGHGNLLNLEAALYAQALGIPIMSLDSTPISDRDYTGGSAKKHYEVLLQQGMVSFSSFSLFCDALSKGAFQKRPLS